MPELRQVFLRKEEEARGPIGATFSGPGTGVRFQFPSQGARARVLPFQRLRVHLEVVSQSKLPVPVEAYQLG